MGGRFFRFGAVLRAVVVGVLVALVTASPALAHNSLASSDPADGARLATPPRTIRLTFLSRLDPQATKVAVTGPDNASALAGVLAFDRATVRVPVHADLAGRYTVSYEAASDDGHPVKGAIRFTLTVGATTSAAPSLSASAASPSAASPSVSSPPLVPTASPAATTSVSATATDQGARPWWPWAVGGAVLVGTAAFAVVAERRRG